MRDPCAGAQGRALVVSGVALLLVLLGGPSLAAAHSRMPAAGTALPALALDGPHGVPPSASPAPALAWVLGALGIWTAITGARWLRRPRRLAVALSVSLAVFAVETALHSAHHLNDPKQAEQCAAYTASLQLSALEASAATPELPRPQPALEVVRARGGEPSARMAAQPPSRAPPVRPA
jgi:hypothetical protein